MKKKLFIILLIPSGFLYTADAVKIHELIKTVILHESPITCMKAGFRKNRLYTGTEKGELVLWQTGGEWIGHRLSGHQSKITDMQTDEQEERLFSASTDHTIKVWDVGDVKALKMILSIDCKDPYCLAFDNRHKKLYAVSSDTIKVWETQDDKLKEESTWSGLCGVIHSLALVDDSLCYSDGKTLLAISDASNLEKNRKLWTPGGLLQLDEGHIFVITPSSEFDKKRVKVLQRSSSQIVDCAYCEGHTDTVTCLTYIKAVKLLCTGSADKTIRFWDPEKLALVASCNGRGTVKCLTANDKELYAGYEDGAIERWSLGFLQELNAKEEA